jgi:ketol-acid reductoisomerase
VGPWIGHQSFTAQLNLFLRYIYNLNYKDLYESVENGSETARTLSENARPDYRERLEKELKEIRDSEMWRAGKTVRQLRPENQK